METVEAAAMEDGTKKRRKGGFRTMPFIFANEVAEKLAVLGFTTNMLMYLTKQLHMPLAKAATTLTNFGGVSAMTPLIGAFLADSFVGRFWTIAAASLVYQLGMTLLTVSAALPVFRPPPCSGGASESCSKAAPWQLSVLYAALLLNAIGAGGYRPCIVAFGADQFDESQAAERARTWGFFNWYYFCNGASQLVAVTAVVYVQDNVGWGWGLGVPTFCMAVSVVAFVAGYPMYRRLEPAGSPFTRLAQVVVAAVRKRRVPRDAAVVDAGTLYENDEMDKPISLYGKLVHTEQLSFFDRAAIVTDGDLITTDASDNGKPPPPPVPNPWRLSTVHRVEELKSVLRMGPIWAAGILAITASSQQHTFSLQQASTMDRRIVPSSAFQIPAGSMTVFTMLAMLATLLAYDRALVPMARRATGLDRGISYLHRMGVGFAVSVSATLVAGFVERRRRDAAAGVPGATNAGTSPLSAYWLVPQYALHGVAEAFNSVGHLEFMYDQSPESMRSMATALFWLSISLGSYVSTALIDAVHRWSAGDDGSNWLPDNINRGKLDYFYWIVTLLQVVNLVYYVICARCYTFKPIQLHNEEENGKHQVELKEKASPLSH